jgi:hypothetical protein
VSSGGPPDDDPRPSPRTPKPKGGDGSGGGDNACDIVERTKVNSPDRTVAVTVRDGDELSVAYESGPPRKLLVRTASGATLGSITSPSMAQIIQCILSGYEYVAVVLSISGGMIEVRIEPK